MDNVFDIRVNLEYNKKMRQYSKNPKKEILEDIYYLRSIIDDNNLEKMNNKLYKKGKYLKTLYELAYIPKNYILFYNSFKKNKDNHFALSKKHKNLKVLYKDKIITKEEVSIEDNINYAIEFMMQYNPDFYATFKELYDNGHIKFTNPLEYKNNGITYPINDGLPYIIIYSHNNIYDAGCLIHEVGHCFQLKYAYDLNKNNPDFYSEVYSHYVQMLFYEYMQKNDKFKSDIKTIKRFALEGLRCRLVRINNYFKNEKMTDSFLNDIKYAYGVTLALYYYNIHLNNPNQAEEYLMSFIETSNLFKQEEVLNRYGINKDKMLTKEIVNSYMK